MSIGEIGEGEELVKTPAETIIAEAIIERDAGEDWHGAVALKVHNECESCREKIREIREAVNTEPEKPINLSALIAEDAYSELKVIGNVVMVKTDGEWQVGIKAVK